jgi:hypothetical protein
MLFSQGIIFDSILNYRAQYDVKKRKIMPPMETWETHCICKSPLNPDYMYIQCEECEKWFHIQCVGLSSNEVETVEKWYCNDCEALCQSGLLIKS